MAPSSPLEPSLLLRLVVQGVALVHLPLIILEVADLVFCVLVLLYCPTVVFLTALMILPLVGCCWVLLYLARWRLVLRVARPLKPADLLSHRIQPTANLTHHPR